MRTILWRGLFVLAGLLIIVGGPQHPDGTMAEMLADPRWVRSHALMLAGFTSLLAGLAVYARGAALAPGVRLWLRLALVGLTLQSVEMAFHTAASVDVENLLAGRPTPVLTTHLWMTPIFYPIFAVTCAGFVVVATRAGVMGSPWIGWLGVMGALAHGAAGFLVPLFDLEWARVLFPMIVLLALWAILAGLWPVRAQADAAPRSPSSGS
jgi:hypothetical protein